jgi:hypothetical protein
VIDQAVFDRDGAARFDRALPADALERLRDLAEPLLNDRPGVRVTGDAWLTTFLNTGPPAQLAKGLTSDKARPVRAVMFDKSPAANWIVAWHQDRTIPVRERIEVAGFGPWSTKAGIVHVAPPFEGLDRMVTLRLHLDDVDETNAPLRIAVGSHQLGRVEAPDAAAEADKLPQILCLASAGDIWAYRTPILHTSDRSTGERRRRVLQVDYADFELPGGLEWQGLDR